MTDVKNEILKRLKDKEEQIIEIRRYLHEHPELSFQEKNTAKYIADFYQDKEADVRTGVGGNGVVVTIDSGNPGKTIAIRADFDALPIQEDSGEPFSSKVEGVMHACGHDGHTAYMLILGETLIEMKDQLKGKIVILHQHAEEVAPGGAKPMIADGALDGVDHVFGIHIISDLETCKIVYCPGNFQTGRANFHVKIQGVGGHASSPHTAKDAIVAGAYFVTEVQSIVSRSLNPFETGSITIGNFDGKGSGNVIKDSVEITGDVRAMSENVREVIEREIRAKLEGMAASFGVTYELNYENDYPVLHNDEETTAFVAHVLTNTEIEEATGVEEIGPIPPSEDFAYYAQERPACFFNVGGMVKDGEVYPHHHPKFRINEEALIVCAKAMASVVVEYLENDGIALNK
ncbi:amidohydrolase [Facklamia lactis]|uniref:amidohydrolase n=1 Tax=Facklamia lactis TaxID=2749967 RepID=UPI0018CE85ED|nr:amidohydrolase [Facklamia lactis]MBG9980313.1 amidohydrolase [Facklamia lactis]